MGASPRVTAYERISRLEKETFRFMDADDAEFWECHDSFMGSTEEDALELERSNELRDPLRLDRRGMMAPRAGFDALRAGWVDDDDGALDSTRLVSVE